MRDRVSRLALGLSRYLPALIGVVCVQLGLLLIAGPFVFWIHGAPAGWAQVVGLGFGVVALVTGARLLRKAAGRGSRA